MSPHRSTRGRERTLLLSLAAACLLAMVTPARPAAGQGTPGMFPDPVTTAELMKFADGLRLDASQRLALESIHDEYMGKSRELRDEELADFLKETRAFQSQGMIPQREEVVSYLKKMERLLARIEELDDRLFNDLLPVLTEEQLPLLDRARLARERQRYQAPVMTGPTGRRAVDVSKVLAEVELPPEVRAEVDPVIADYERRLTSQMREISKAGARMNLDMLDAFAERGYEGMTQEELADPEIMAKVMQDMQEVWSEIGAALTEKAARITDLNRRTYRRIAALLPEAAARDFRTRYYGEEYPEISFVLDTRSEKRFAHMIEREGLSDQQREAIAAAVDGFRQELDRMVDDAVKQAEARREGSSPFDFDRQSMQDRQQELMKMHKTVAELTASTSKSINEIIGEKAPADVVEDAQRKALALVGAEGLLDGPVEARADGEAEDAGGRERPSGRWNDQWVAGPISEREIARYAATQDLDDAAGSALRDLHAEYVERFMAIDAIVRLPAANQELWRYDPETGTVQPPLPGAFEKIDQLRRTALEEIKGLDQSFFGEVQGLVGDGQEQPLARLQARRLRQVYQAVGATEMYYMGFGQSVEPGIDLVELLEARKLDDDELERIDPLLAAYEGSALDLFRTRYAARLAYSELLQKWSVEVQALQGDMGAAMDYGRRYQEAMGGVYDKVREADGRVTELNRRTRDEVVTALTPEAGASIRRAYDRAAFPSIYKDRMAADRPLAKALKLDDLTEEQRQRLDGLEAAYRPEYERLSQAMIAQAGGPAMNPMSCDPAAWQEHEQREEQLRTLRFDRDELCHRAIYGLKAVLTAEQLERIGPLPEPKEKDSIYSETIISE